MDRKHYSIIEEFYGDREAQRSGIPLIYHILDGLIVLDHIGASAVVENAWCIHPIVQSDDDFRREIFDYNLVGADSSAIVLAVEYRNVANSYLSADYRDFGSVQICTLRDRLADFKMIRQMLIADKIQNYKDFKAQPAGTYVNEAVLEAYFNEWIFEILELSQEQYEEYTGIIGEEHVSSN